MADLLYRLSKNSFVRLFDNYGYIVNQLTRHDRVYDNIGKLFLAALSRKPATFDELLDVICENFDESSWQEIRVDLMAFLVELEKDKYIVTGESEEEIKEKDPSFSYAFDPKTIKYNFQQNPDDLIKFKDSTEILRTKHNEIPQIHSCQIEVTNCCNERCIHCYIPHKEKNKILPLSVIDSVLQQLSTEMHTLGLTITGGDPFMHPEIKEILKLARKYDFSFNVLSNFTLIKPEHIELLKDLNIASLQTSLYSVVPAEHNHITQLPGSCEQTMRMIDKLVSANIPVQIACPVMRTNYKSYKKVLAFAKERNCKAYTDFVLMGRSDYTTDNLNERLSLDETEELLRDIMKYDKDYVDSLTPSAFEKKSDIKEWSKEPICGIARDSISIASTGDVYPCSGWTRMPCGNVKEQPIKKIWEESPIILKLRQLVKGDFKQCGTCDYHAFCNICPSRNASEANGDYMKESQHHCDVIALNYRLAQEFFQKRQEEAK